MALTMCRLCLSGYALGPIFANENREKRLSLVLGLTTGLKIEPNDGLPQLICRDCTCSVNTALDLRNRSHTSEIKLITRGCKRKSENTCEDTEPVNEVSKENNNVKENNEDACDINGVNAEPDVELAEDGGQEEAKVVSSPQPVNAVTMDLLPTAVKYNKEVYLTYVEGKYIKNLPVQCKVCKMTMSSWPCFINHVKKHIGYTYTCEYCAKGFISSNQLKRHCRSFHGMPREIQCKYCDYLALDNAQLAVHVRRAHTDERPFQCDACGAAFFSRKCIVQHIESHRVDYSVQCNECQASFKSRRHLAKHKYRVHKKHRTRSSVRSV